MYTGRVPRLQGDLLLRRASVLRLHRRVSQRWSKGDADGCASCGAFLPKQQGGAMRPPRSTRPAPAPRFGAAYPLRLSHEAAGLARENEERKRPDVELPKAEAPADSNNGPSLASEPEALGDVLAVMPNPTDVPELPACLDRRSTASPIENVVVPTGPDILIRADLPRASTDSPVHPNAAPEAGYAAATPESPAFDGEAISAPLMATSNVPSFRSLEGIEFRYERLDSTVAADVRDAAARITTRLQVQGRHAIEIGADLKTVKARLPHGLFGPWLTAEFGWTERTAQRFMRLADTFGSESDIVSGLPLTLLHQLAAPSTPAGVRAPILNRIRRGELVVAAEIAETLRAANARGAQGARGHPRTGDHTTAPLLVIRLSRGSEVLASSSLAVSEDMAPDLEQRVKAIESFADFGELMRTLAEARRGGRDASDEAAEQ